MTDDWVWRGIGVLMLLGVAAVLGWEWWQRHHPRDETRDDR